MDISSTKEGHEVHQIEEKFQKKTPNISYRATSFFTALFTPFGKIDNRLRFGVVAIQAFLILLLLQLANSQIIPTPLNVLSAFGDLFRNSIFMDNLISTFGTVFFAMITSIIITMVLVYLSKIPFFAFFAWFVSICRYLTLPSLVVLVTFLTSNVGQMKDWLLICGIVPYFTVSLLNATKLRQQEIDKSFLNKNNAWETLWEVVIVGKLDQLILVMQQNFAIAWSMIAMVEGLAMSEGGIGTMLIKSGKYLHLAPVFAILITVLLIGMFFDFLFGFIRKTAFRYIIEK